MANGSVYRTCQEFIDLWWIILLWRLATFQYIHLCHHDETLLRAMMETSALVWLNASSRWSQGTSQSINWWSSLTVRKDPCPRNWYILKSCSLITLVIQIIRHYGTKSDQILKNSRISENPCNNSEPLPSQWKYSSKSEPWLLWTWHWNRFETQVKADWTRPESVIQCTEQITRWKPW